MLNENKALLEKLKAKVAANAKLDELIATVESS